MSQGFCCITFSADQQDQAGRPHACPKCQRQFRRLEHLKRHARTHTKERPFTCSCGVSFTRRDLLKRHTKVSHPSPQATGRSTYQDFGTGSAEEGGGQPNARIVQRPEDSLHLIEYPTVPTTSDDHGDEGQQFFVHTDSDGDYRDDFTVEEAIHLQDPGSLSMTEESRLEGLEQVWEMPQMLMEYEPTGWRSTSNQGRHLAQQPSQCGRFRPATDEVADPVPGHGLKTTLKACRFPSPQPAIRDISIGLIQTWAGSNKTPSDAGRELVSKHLHRRLQDLLLEYTGVLPGFKLPSHSRLDRYVKSYFDGWTRHLSFLHESTLDLEAQPAEFVLALASLGAQWCLEQRNALNFYLASMAILRRRAMFNDQFPGSGRKPLFTPEQAYSYLSTSVVLLGYAPWESPEVLGDISALICIVTPCIEIVGMKEGDSTETSWHGWVKQESRRRLCFVAFVLLETLSLAYNLPPALFGSRLGLALPCESRLWHADTAHDWAILKAASGAEDQSLYRDALSAILQWQPGQPAPGFQMTAQGGYFLIHGLLQRIQLLREISVPLIAQSSELPSGEVERLKNALNIWSTLWDRSSKTNPDLSSFISCTLLALAHIRIHIDFSPYENLASRDPELIAAALLHCPPVPRQPQVISALAHATDLLTLTIGIGMDSLARNHKYVSAIRHALAGFESAVFLSKWLGAVHGTEDLSDHEGTILVRIRQNMVDGYNSVDRPADVFVFGETKSPSEWNCQQLGLGVLAVWSRVLNHDSPWSILSVMGASLDRYASRLDRRSSLAA